MRTSYLFASSTSVALEPDRRRALARLLQSAAAVMVGAGLPAAHAGYNIFLNEYTVPEAELRQRIASRFPVQLAYAEIFALSLRNPRLVLDPAANRLRVTSDLRVSNPLFMPRPVSGTLAISGGLRWDAASRALRLVQPQSEQLELQGLSARDSRHLKDVGALVAREVLSDFPLHTFAPEDLRVGSKTLEPGDITVLVDGIRIAFR